MRKRIALFVAVAGVFLAVIFASNGETPEKKLAARNTPATATNNAIRFRMTPPPNELGIALA